MPFPWTSSSRSCCVVRGLSGHPHGRIPPAPCACEPKRAGLGLDRPRGWRPTRITRYRASTASSSSAVSPRRGSVGLFLGPGDEREPRPLLDRGEPVGPADRVELEGELGQGVELVLAVGDEVVGPAEAPDRLGRAGDDLPALPAGVPRRRGDPPAVRQPRVNVVPGALARVSGSSHRARIAPGRRRRPGVQCPADPSAGRRAGTSPVRSSLFQAGGSGRRTTAGRGCIEENESPRTGVTDRAWIDPGQRRPGSSARPTLPPAVSGTSPVRLSCHPLGQGGRAEHRTAGRGCTEQNESPRTRVTTRRGDARWLGKAHRASGSRGYRTGADGREGHSACRLASRGRSPPTRGATAGLPAHDRLARLRATIASATVTPNSDHPGDQLGLPVIRRRGVAHLSRREHDDRPDARVLRQKDQADHGRPTRERRHQIQTESHGAIPRSL